MSDSRRVVVVARTGLTAKSRLAGVLTPDERAGLARAMLADVLAVCVQVDSTPIVVTDSFEGDRGALAAGAMLVGDPGDGMNGAVTAGVRAALEGGLETVLVVAGDLPLLKGEDLAALREAASGRGRAVVICLDRHGTGTNALLLRPPTVIAPSFGRDSARRHAAAAATAGAVTIDLRLPNVAMDIDEPADLANLLVEKRTGATGRFLTCLSGSRSLPGG